MEKNEILRWLLERDEARLDELWKRADDVRRVRVGDEVHLRGLVEISNYCVRQCRYCGINASLIGSRFRVQGSGLDLLIAGNPEP
jgi:biotin synthase